MQKLADDCPFLCAHCSFVNDRNVVRNHILSVHRELKEVPAYCSGCDLRGHTCDFIRKHVAMGTPKCRKEWERKRLLDPTLQEPRAVQNPHHQVHLVMDGVDCAAYIPPSTPEEATAAANAPVAAYQTQLSHLGTHLMPVLPRLSLILMLRLLYPTHTASRGTPSSPLQLLTLQIPWW